MNNDATTAGLRTISPSPTRRVYTVSELNGLTRLLLSTHFGSVWVEGEISNLSAPSSGHFYFTLKDRDAQVRCALFRGVARMLPVKLANGLLVTVRAQVSLYEARGDYQLIVEELEEAGDGALRRAFEALKRKLAAEGLFDQSRKQPLPRLPACIGVITSPTGAALRDVLTVLRRRFPAIPVIVYPTRVQGAGAEIEIADAIARADRLAQVDVLILARGGGSLEDLQAFNEERVARAIAACSIPLVAGLGHETDVSIADLVADLRAPTPSAAAEAVSPDRSEWLARLQGDERRLRQNFLHQLNRHRQRLDFVERRLQQVHPLQNLKRDRLRIEQIEQRLLRAWQMQWNGHRSKLAGLSAILNAADPRRRLAYLLAAQAALARRLEQSMNRIVERRKASLGQLSKKLDAISPLATLRRGYSITLRERDRRLVQQCGDVQPGDRIVTRLTDGEVTSRVE